MLTATEVVFLKDLIQQLSALAEVSEYTQNEIDEALELIDSLKPLKTEDFLEVMEKEKEDD